MFLNLPSIDLPCRNMVPYGSEEGKFRQLVTMWKYCDFLLRRVSDGRIHKRLHFHVMMVVCSSQVENCSLIKTHLTLMLNLELTRQNGDLRYLVYPSLETDGISYKISSRKCE